ncbi:hypothetical protein KSP39_PZI001415 [Platanthera zijinensis]|uniref:High chlorophyll fluorescence 153 n=1 Tax=Platanthera zijinensis TaxID=2320716 RepID=A0AAP0C304_9ASPA
MAASLIAPSTLPIYPPRLFLLRRTPAALPLSNSVFPSFFSNLRIPSEISRQFNPLRPRPRPGELTVVRAGPPTTSTLILVFVFPLSLLIGTILVSIRISDKLDEKFFEELAVNQAMMEAEEEEEEEEEAEDSDSRAGEAERVLVKEEASAVRIRNRPKRQA